MPRYKVVQRHRDMSGELREEGEIVEVDGYPAEMLLRDGVIAAEEPPAVEEPDDTIDAGDESVNATAAAEALAKENEIDLSALEGSGKDGLITKADVAAAVKAKQEAEQQ